MSICTFFGHRDCSDAIKPMIKKAIKTLIDTCGVKYFYVGNHGRFDVLVLQALRELQKDYTDLSYSVVCSSLTKKMIYYNENETCIPEGVEAVPKRFAISFCNQWMLKKASYVVAYVTRTWGGAAQFVQKAEKAHKTVIYLSPEMYET